MPSKADWQAALAICAAIIGAGFASGREIVSFFSGFGAASWLGIAAASAGIGAIIYIIMKLSETAKPDSFPDLYGRLMGIPCRDAIHLLHGLLCLFTSASMLAAGSELGALAFPHQHARFIGYALTLSLAVAAVCMGLQTLSAMGAVLIPATSIYFLIIALKGAYSPPLLIDGILPSVPMGLIYASFNGALAGGTICESARKNASAKRTACLTALLFFALLGIANLAMLRVGDIIRQMTLPAVAAASALGAAGYYMSIAVIWLAVVTTLCAMLRSLRTQLLSLRTGQIPSLFLCAALPSLMAVLGFQILVDAVYPLIGWICSFALIALFFFLPDHHEDS